MVRKTLTAVFTAALIMSVTAVSAFAACDGRGRNYVDNNYDGVCDNYDVNARNCIGSHIRCGGACNRQR